MRTTNNKAIKESEGWKAFAAYVIEKAPTTDEIQGYLDYHRESLPNDVAQMIDNYRLGFIGLDLGC